MTLLRVLSLFGLMSVTAGAEPASTDLDVFATPETRREAGQIFLGCYAEGWDHGDLLLPIVLEHGYLQVCANTEDYFPVEGARTTARELARLFPVVGLEEHFHFAETEHGHGWNEEVYEKLYAFLSYTLNGAPAYQVKVASKKRTSAYTIV